MKAILSVLFFGLSLTMFSANAVEKNIDTTLNNTIVKKEIKLDIKEDVKLESNNEVAFQVYYVFKWLYVDSPFIKKLDALA